MRAQDNWQFKSELAQLEARSKPQPKGSPPHWLRCEYFKGEKRCVKAEGHQDEHKTAES
ncbi:hypothetical protein [Bradyrhizobium sp.]|uniref:hypothetical protein n=1 Tax=Bradyrhizobium sp. TaxID=376 RepID=UPI003C418A3D